MNVVTEIMFCRAIKSLYLFLSYAKTLRGKESRGTLLQHLIANIAGIHYRLQHLD